MFDVSDKRREREKNVKSNFTLLIFKFSLLKRVFKKNNNLVSLLDSLQLISAADSTEKKICYDKLKKIKKNGANFRSLSLYFYSSSGNKKT